MSDTQNPTCAYALHVGILRANARAVKRLDEGQRQTAHRGTVRGRVRVGAPETVSEPVIVIMRSRFEEFTHIAGMLTGVIFDTGNPFQHMGVLARELGIPAIYQTRRASRVLADGDLVELDGDAGTVRLL